MAKETFEEALAKGEELFSRGKIDEATAVFQAILNQEPAQCEALNNMGVICHARGDSEEAERYFSRALDAKGDNLEALANLADLYNATGKKDREAECLEKIVALRPDDMDATSRLALLYIDTISRNKPDQRPFDPPERQASGETELPGTSNSEVSTAFRNVNESGSIKPTMPKVRVAVLCMPGLESFLADIVIHLQKNYEVRTCYSRDGRELAACVAWADIVWLEWGNEMAVQLTQKVPGIRNKKVLCRVHRYEVFQPAFKEIQWDYIDKVVFVAGFMGDLALQVVPDLDKRSSMGVLHNGIHMERFNFAERKPGYNIAVVGYIHSRKNPYFWPMIMSKLKDLDRRYTLHVAGQFQEAECKLYLDHMISKFDLGNNIKFHGHQKNIHQWLENKSYLLATSVHESFGYTIGEAMAMGIRPVVHWFPGADELWPEECLFTTIEDAVAMVRDRNNYNSFDYRRFVEDRYGLELQLERISTLIEDLLNGGGRIDRSSPDIEPASKPASKARAKKPSEKRITNNSTSRDQHTIANNSTSRDQHSDVISQNLPKGYSTGNPLGLILKQDENINNDYMNLQYFMRNNDSLSTQDLLQRLQTSFHRMINSFCNNRTVPQDEVTVTSMVMQKLSRNRGWKNPLGKTFSVGSLCGLFHFLKTHLPEALESCSVQLQDQDVVLQQLPEKSPVHALYREMHHIFKDLYDENIISSFMVHGSMATLDYTRFSDVDTQLFLTDKAFNTQETIVSLSETVSKANRLLSSFDTLQHHGYFISTDLDRRWYPEAYLPLNTMAYGVAVLGEREQTFSVRTSEYENCFALWHTGYFFRASYISRSFPQTPFDMKRFLSRFSLLPVLYLELFHDLYPYKRDSFEMAAPYFDSELWRIFDVVRRVRENWNPFRLIKFSDTFYRKVFNISEIMLDKLTEVRRDKEKH